MNKIKKYLVLLLIGLLVLGFTSISFGQDELFEEDEVRTIKGPKWAPGEIIVKFKRGISEDVIRQINQRHGTSILSISKRGQFMRLRIPGNRTVEEMVSIYSRNPNVEYAEPNFIAYALMIPNDPYYSYQWHLDNPDYGGIHMESAWDTSAGSGVTIAVIDTGIAYEDYQSGKGRWKESYYQAPDLNETCFVEGFDFVNDDTHPNDDNSHGTHVAGTIAQSTNNNKGVAGIAYQSCLMPVKVLDENGAGTFDDVADGIYFAADNGAAVINLSLGGISPSITLENAVAYAYNKGVTIVCAAGNEYLWGNYPLYPAAYDAYCIAVGATRYDEKRAYYSNTGSYLDIVAPGGDLTVDQNGDGYADGVLQNTFNPNSKNTADFGYWFFQGTSMAAPHVAGVAALLISDGVTGPDNIRAVLESTAEDLGGPEWDEIYGWGLIDAAAALQWTTEPDTTPPVISNGKPTGAINNSTPVLEVTTDEKATCKGSIYLDEIYVDMDFTFTADAAGTSHSYQVPDGDAISDGDHTPCVKCKDETDNINEISYTWTFTVDTVAPDKVTGLTLTIVSDSQIDLSWYTVSDAAEYKIYRDGSYLDSTTTTYYSDTGLAAETTYYYKVSAVDKATNEGTASDEVSGTTEAAANVMYVGDIVMSSGDCISRGPNTWCKAIATVPILDNSGAGVEGVEVTGSWSGAYEKTGVTATTDSSGNAVFETGYKKTPGTFNFCVDDVVKTDWTYNSSYNLDNCDNITLY